MGAGALQAGPLLDGRWTVVHQARGRWYPWSGTLGQVGNHIDVVRDGIVRACHETRELVRAHALDNHSFVRSRSRRATYTDTYIYNGKALSVHQDHLCDLV